LVLIGSPMVMRNPTAGFALLGCVAFLLIGPYSLLGATRVSSIATPPGDHV
jgi:hypothetical protein